MNKYDTTIRVCQNAVDAANQRYNLLMGEIKRELADPNVDEQAKAKLRAKLHNLESEMRGCKGVPAPGVQGVPGWEAGQK